MSGARTRFARAAARLSALAAHNGPYPYRYQRLMTGVFARFTIREKGVGWEPLVAGGVPAAWVVPDGADRDRVVLYFHGGGYVIGSIESHRNLVARVAREAGCRALSVGYRLAPEHPFPSALEDALASYRWLVAQGFEPEKIVAAGDSAGGGLAVALIAALRDAGEPLPAGAMLLSPWVDLGMTGASVRTVGWRDPMLFKGVLERWASLYLGGRDAREPLASPLYADLEGLPPLFIQVGTRELLLDDARRLRDRAEAAGVEVELEAWEGMFHGWQELAPFLEESTRAIEGLGRFARARTGG